MYIIMALHMMFLILKMIFMGIFSAFNDIISVVILWCGLSLNSYCPILGYMIFTLMDAFILFVSVGYLI